MRTSLLALSLLAACQTDPAPPADPALAAKSPHDEVAELAAQVDALAAQLREAQATIAGLKGQVAELGVASRSQSDAQKTTAQNLSVLEVQQEELGAHLADLDHMLVEVDPTSGARTDKVEALAIRQAAAEDDIGALRDYGDETTSFLTSLAGASYRPGDGAEALHDALFATSDDGVSTPRVDGVIAASTARMRQRPETLFQEWDALIQEELATLTVDPNNALGALHAKLGELTLRLEATVHFVDDWQGETAYLRVQDDTLREEIGRVARGVAEGDAALQCQLDGVLDAVCPTTALAEALFLGDDAAARRAYADRGGEQVCGRTDHL